MRENVTSNGLLVRSCEHGVRAWVGLDLVREKTAGSQVSDGDPMQGKRGGGGERASHIAMLYSSAILVNLESIWLSFC